jgi:hypothetical protein
VRCTSGAPIILEDVFSSGAAHRVGAAVHDEAGHAGTVSSTMRTVKTAPGQRDAVLPVATRIRNKVSCCGLRRLFLALLLRVTASFPASRAP